MYVVASIPINFNKLLILRVIFGVSFNSVVFQSNEIKIKKTSSYW